jgi:hypothetical protein
MHGVIRSPAQVFALVAGLALTTGGVAGFFWDASFATGDGVARDAVLGLLDVNGWHNLAHIASGVLGLLLAASWGGARAYAIALGAVYAALAIAGFIAGDGGTLLGLLPVNTGDNVLHALIALWGLAAGIGTPPVPAPTTAAG